MGGDVLGFESTNASQSSLKRLIVFDGIHKKCCDSVVHMSHVKDWR